MRDAYEQRRAYLSQAVEKLPYPDGAVGVVAMMGPRERCADIFDRSEMMRAHWPRLIRSYAIEAFDSKVPPPSTSSARRLLMYPIGADRNVFSSPGMGLDVRLANRHIVGAALVCEGIPIHTSVFRRVQA